MPPNDLNEQLVKYLTDAHSIEQQALVQMKDAKEIAGYADLERIFAQHLTETEEHERLVRERLEFHGAAPSSLKDFAGKVTGKGFSLFAKFQPDTPGKLLAHGLSYERMELAAYDLLERVAERAGDTETAEVARRIREQERAMADRLEASFDRAVDASLREQSPDDLDEQLGEYLADAHAIEEQAIKLLEKGPEIVGVPELVETFEEHLAETRRHEQLIDARLKARDESPSKLQDAVLSLSALNWGMFFQAQPDTPAKLAAFAYAFEHLEIASYELLWRVAQRAGDSET